MFQRKIRIVLLVSVMLLAAVPGAAEDGVKSSAVSGLLSESPKDRWEAFIAIRDERSKLINELVAIVDDDKTDPYYEGPLHLVIMLLGSIHASNGSAIGALSKRLMYIPVTPGGSYRIDSSMGETEAYYPAAVSLVIIGQPAIQEMIWKIRATDDELERNEAAWVIMRIEGQEQALLRLQQAIDALPETPEAINTPTLKRRLEGAREYIRTWKRSTDHPLAIKRKKEREKSGGSPPIEDKEPATGHATK